MQAMHTWTRHWRMRARIAWIACLAILFNVFAPVVSHAMEAAARAPIVMDVEVCTALGMVTMPVALASPGAGSDESAPGKLHKNMSHCGYCAAHAAAHGLPPPMGAAFAPVGGRDAYPPLYYHAARPLFPWSPAQPRAPPILA
jgi:Protein of unknown function (DUF2946)